MAQELGNIWIFCATSRLQQYQYVIRTVFNHLEPRERGSKLTCGRTIIANAYVSGMKEDLNFQGNEYNLLQTFFTCRYLVGQIPSQFILTKGWLYFAP